MDWFTKCEVNLAKNIEVNDFRAISGPKNTPYGTPKGTREYHISENYI